MSRIGVVVFPGSNCEYDAAAAVERLGDEAEFIWHTRTDIDGIDGVILPGGFAHGDYLRPGALARFSPVMERSNDSPRPVARCSGSATDSRSSSKRECCPARCRRTGVSRSSVNRRRSSSPRPRQCSPVARPSVKNSSYPSITSRAPTPVTTRPTTRSNATGRSCCATRTTQWFT